MTVKQFLLPLFFVLLQFASCRSNLAKPYDFPVPVNTTTRPISEQVKKVYQIPEDGLFADNLFRGARINGFAKAGNQRYRVRIEPENCPINPSPWYAFRIWAEARQNIILELDYALSHHRYRPKISHDGDQWSLLDSSLIRFAPDSVNVFIELEVGPDTIWIAAQELYHSEDIRKWCRRKGRHEDVTFSVIGKSALNRDLYCLDIGNGPERKKDVIVILSRQHPPEVTGFLAMQAFVESLLDSTALSEQFRQRYRVLVFPLLNPDGVDLGHWRHNTGGIDLNRDWAMYNQPETRQIADYIVSITKKAKNRVIWGLDFHSTYRDVYYTNDRSLVPHLPGLKDRWLRAIEAGIPGFKVNEKPSGLSTPTTKGWFYTQFGAEGITYEIGDQTPREFIDLKGRVSATALMQLLVDPAVPPSF